jgi:RNA polymerase sigma-70 factor (ECF subfamily)
MLHTLRRLGVPTADIEDVAHDVFVAVYRHVAQYDATRPLRPWLFTFAYRTAKDHRALARHRHETAGPIEHVHDPALRADDQLDAERLRDLLLRVLGELDFDKRSIVVMHDVEGMPVPAIAELLGVPVNTAYSRLRLARAEFERHLERLGGRP